ncbi:hypothetical protein BG006_000942 [Podila minutissima]|uniref:Uncharacterized protein n=1 Tax=Podila minutissima TaxID=64525 RepID=A0A9P5VHI3_9FUNG|nr:hypothetical protein BG006_000942 [Podila minutissima]
MLTAEKPPLLSSTATKLTPPKTLSPEMIMLCIPQWDGLKCSTISNNPFDGLMEADLQRCGWDSPPKNENKVSQENTVDRTMESLDDLFPARSPSWTPPVEQPRPSRVQQGIKDSVTHTHTHKLTIEAEMMHRCTVSCVNPLSTPLIESQKEQALNKQMTLAPSLYWHEQSDQAGSGPLHRPPVDAKTLTITTMAQFELLKKAVISSNVVGLSIKEDGTTSAKSTRLQPHFNFCVLQVVCSSEPRTVFKLEVHRLEHDASSRKDIFTAYDSTTTKYIIPGSNTARSLSAHLIVLLQELLKNPSIVKLSYNWRFFLSSANKTLTSAIGSTTDHKNMVDLRDVGLIFTKTKAYITTSSSSSSKLVPTTILCKNQGKTQGVDDDDYGDEDNDDREAKRWLPDLPRAKAKTKDSQRYSVRLPLTTRDQTMLATPDVTLSAWTLRPGLARTFYRHPNIISLLAKITGKRVGTTHWVEEPGLPYMTPLFRTKCQYADERALFVLEVYSLLQKVRQLKG